MTEHHEPDDVSGAPTTTRAAGADPGVEERTFEVNGLRLPALVAGPEGGPVVLCLHGFPDTRHGFFEGFGQRLAAAGFRVVAPAMRGYEPEAIPVDGDFGPLALGRDALALVEALGGRVAIVGNDWGALAGMLAAVMGPERVDRLVTLGIPHPLAVRWTPAMAWRARHFASFQLQGLAARRLRRDDFALVEGLYRRWSPTWRFGPEALREIRAAYGRPGVVEASLAPYRDIRRQRAQLDPKLRTRITVPTLALGGGEDPSIPPDTYERARRGFSAEYRWDLVPGVGHFIQREDPAAAAERVIAFLREG